MCIKHYFYVKKVKGILYCVKYSAIIKEKYSMDIFRKSEARINEKAITSGGTYNQYIFSII